MNSYSRFPDALLVQVCEAFLRGGRRMEAVVGELNALFERQRAPYRVSREQIYPLLRQARDRGLFELRAPVGSAGEQRLADYFRCDAACLDVVAAHDQIAHTLVASRAAEVCLRAIKHLSQTREGNAVHLGFEGGETVRSVAQHLAAKLRNDEAPPPVVLHALSPGLHPDQPHTAPVTFFSLFQNLGDRVGYVGFFAPSAVRDTSFRKTRELPGAREGYQQKRNIDVVIASPTSRENKDGDLNRLLRHDDTSQQLLATRGWIGDVQHRPYSARGPIHHRAVMRAVTLFELEELVTFANADDKEVILVAGPCATSLRTEEDALLPLMTNPRLKLWSRLVTDLRTAERLLDLARSA